MSSSSSRPDISLAQVAGSALAAVSAAVIASFLGVGGTVLGAALGSTVATIGGAVYAHTFRQAGQKLGETRVLTVVSRARLTHEPPGPGDVPLVEPGADGPATTTGGRSGPRLGGRPPWMTWQALAAMAVAAFLVAMVVISAIELTIGRPISGGSGTTVSKLVHHSSSRHPSTPAPGSHPVAHDGPRAEPDRQPDAGADRDRQPDADRHAVRHTVQRSDRDADDRRSDRRGGRHPGGGCDHQPRLTERPTCRGCVMMEACPRTPRTDRTARRGPGGPPS